MAAIFGVNDAVLSRIVYILVDPSAWQLMPLRRAFSVDEPMAQRHHQDTAGDWPAMQAAPKREPQKEA